MRKILLLLVFSIPGATPAPAQQTTRPDDVHHAMVLNEAPGASAVAALGADVRREFARMTYVTATSAELAEMRRQGLRVRELPAPDRIGLVRGAVDPKEHVLEAGDLVRGETNPAIVVLDGPWAPDWMDRIEARGVSFVSLVPPYGALVRGSPDALLGLADLPFVLALAPYRPEWRLTERLTDAGPGEHLVTLVGFEGADLSDAYAVAASGGNIVSFTTTLSGSDRVEAFVDASLLLELAALPGVRSIDLATQGSSHNEKMRVIMQTERVWNSTPQANQDFYNPVYGIGVKGENQWVVVTDEGILPTHEALAQNNPPKMLPTYVPSVIDPSCIGLSLPGDEMNHGTHVVGSIAGNHIGSTNFMSPNLYDGLAFRSRIFLQAIAGPNGEFCVPDPYVDPILTFPYNRNDAFRIHNASWGHGPQGGTFPSQTLGMYSQISVDVDEFLYERPDAVQIFSVGNFGHVWTQPSVYVPGSLSDDSMAKNVIAVGAVGNGDFRHQMYHWSSRGPTDDGSAGPGRVKPDVVAPGEFLISAESTGNSDYGEMWPGTSFAAPVISGAAALVRDYFTQGHYPIQANDPPLPLLPYTSSALVKAMLINSTVWVQGFTGYESCVPPNFGCYPNYDQGYGRPALDTVLEPAGYRDLKAFEDTTTHVAVGQTWSRTLILKDIWQADCTNLRVTLVWTDPPGDTTSYPKLVNDLDLVVTIAPNSANPTVITGNHQLLGNGTPDTLNNVEDVMWTPLVPPNGANRRVRIDVHGISGTMTSADPQDFAVVLTYGPCFDVTPCFGVGGCYAGPGDTVPGSIPPSGGCNPGHYDLGDCGIDCGEDPSVDCEPPTPHWQPADPVPHEQLEPHRP